MSDQKTGYEVVIHDLEQELRRIEGDLAALEEQRDHISGTLVWLKERHGTIARRAAPSDRAPYQGMGIADATVAFLRAHGRPADTNTLVMELKRGGLDTKSKSLYQTIYGVLNRDKDKPGSLLAKTGTSWALREWGPQEPSGSFNGEPQKLPLG